MSADFPQSLEPISSSVAAVLAVGLTAVLVVLFAARRLLGRKGRSPLPPRPDPRDLLRRATPPPGVHDRRQVPRRYDKTVGVHIRGTQGRTVPEVGWIVDRSSQGVCIAVERSVEEGALLSLVPVNAPPNTPGVEVRVCYCRQQRQHHYLDCQFVQTPAWSVLLLFG